MTNRIDIIDKAMMLVPPSARKWEVADAQDFRFGWDKRYKEEYKQDFSPWFFGRNCAAVLGHVRMHGRTSLMSEMADRLYEAVRPHIHRDQHLVYIENRFEFLYLWQVLDAPFYGAFMNNVTAHGLLQLYEATGVQRYLLLAHNLLLTTLDQKAHIPLSGGENGLLWLYEYVFHVKDTVPKIGRIGFSSRKDWHYSEVFNGHLHALFPYFRFNEMFSTDEFDPVIERALSTTKAELPTQMSDRGYFSYCKDVPQMPDYGQERAYRLAAGLAEVANDPEISEIASRMEAFYLDNVQGREREILAAEISETRKTLIERP